jgi:hypothetical protein
LKAKAFTYECAAYGRQTLVTAGTIMHASKLDVLILYTTVNFQGPPVYEAR